MTGLIENILERNEFGYVHLNGSVPSKQRKELMSRFREDIRCKVFLSTDAGGVGLNLQSGSVVINMDIPWNPAVLEQRIGRVHRIGQYRTVRVINFITKCSIEEKILDLLKFKRSLFTGVLDNDGEDIVMIGESKLKKLMETVETISEDIKKTDTVFEDEQKELYKETDDTEQIVKKRDTDISLNDFLISGAKFLMNISKTISESNEPIEKHLHTMIGKDEKTGKSYLKIPLPEPEVINNIFSAISELISKTKTQ